MKKALFLKGKDTTKRRVITKKEGIGPLLTHILY
jgi:hypothetical protein